jgi:hypothetical protein
VGVSVLFPCLLVWRCLALRVPSLSVGRVRWLSEEVRMLPS